MIRTESKLLDKKFFEFSFGPIRLRSASVREAQDQEAEAVFCSQSLQATLQRVIDEALANGCTRLELEDIFRTITQEALDADS